MDNTTGGAPRATAGHDCPSVDAIRAALHPEEVERLSANGTTQLLADLLPLCSTEGHVILLALAQERGIADLGGDASRSFAGRAHLAAVAYLEHREVFVAARTRVLEGVNVIEYHASRAVDAEALASDEAANDFCNMASIRHPSGLMLGFERTRQSEETVIRLTPLGEELRCHPRLGRLTIRTRWSSMAELYRVSFGHLFFKDATLFPARSGERGTPPLLVRDDSPSAGPASRRHCRVYTPAGVRELSSREYKVQMESTDFDVLLDGTCIWEDRSFRAIVRDEFGRLVDVRLSKRSLGIWTKLMKQPHTPFTAAELVAPEHLDHPLKPFERARTLIDSQTESGAWRWSTVHRDAARGVYLCTFRPPPDLRYVLVLPCGEDA